MKHEKTTQVLIFLINRFFSFRKSFVMSHIMVFNVYNKYFSSEYTVVSDYPYVAQDGAAFGSMGCGNSSIQTPDREFFDGQISKVTFKSPK